VATPRGYSRTVTAIRPVRPGTSTLVVPRERSRSKVMTEPRAVARTLDTGDGAMARASATRMPARR
jgi:hypothetical protein